MVWGSEFKVQSSEFKNIETQNSEAQRKTLCSHFSKGHDFMGDYLSSVSYGPGGVGGAGGSSSSSGSVLASNKLCCM